MDTALIAWTASLEQHQRFLDNHLQYAVKVITMEFAQVRENWKKSQGICVVSEGRGK